MADKGSLLTSVIIFYLSIGAAVFHLLEEPNWRTAVHKYQQEKERILQTHPCLTKDDLDTIIEVGTHTHTHTHTQYYIYIYSI
ncbi:potassium channel subfamily K member 5 [Silurus meridionalis]|nr:potassium channel subfamily K member 5 [Silurus meridionalis]